jgi:5'(3')-deoxyribonucleotidase
MATKDMPVEAGQEARKVIALDVDGTIADLATQIIKIVKDRYNVELTVDQLTKYHVEELVPSMTRAEFVGILKEIWDNYKEIGLVDKQIPRILEDVHKDYEIHVVTAAVGTDDQIRDWLRINNITYDKFVHVAHQADKQKEGADIYVDDYFEVAKQVAVLDKNVIIIKQPWSEIDEQVILNSHNKIVVAQSWVEVRELLLPRLLRREQAQ